MNLHLALLFIRLLLYNLIGFFILVLAYSANKGRGAVTFKLHLCVALMFFVLGIFTLIGVAGIDPNRLYTDAMGDYIITPILISILVTAWFAARRTERNYVKDLMEKVKPNGHN